MKTYWIIFKEILRKSYLLHYLSGKKFKSDKKVLFSKILLVTGRTYLAWLIRFNSGQELKNLLAGVSVFSSFLLQKPLKIFLILAGLFFQLSYTVKAQPDFEKTIFCVGYSPDDSLLFFQNILHSDFATGCQFPLLCRVGSSTEKYPDLLSDVRYVLSCYPELQGRKIKVYYSPIKQTMNSRPCFRNLFVKRENRTYRIIINNNSGKEKGLPIADLPDEIQIGFIAHEVAHMLTYDEMNNLQTLEFTLKYVFSKEFVHNVERYTDNVAIQHNLARQLYAGTAYCRNCPDLTPKYRVYANNYGLKLSEIICLWHKTLSSDSLPDDSNLLISSVPVK